MARRSGSMPCGGLCNSARVPYSCTGAWFGYQRAGIAPDVLTLAKALGNGFRCLPGARPGRRLVLARPARLDLRRQSAGLPSAKHHGTRQPAGACRRAR